MAAPSTRFAALVSDELDTARQLIALLNQETDCLVAADTDGLDSLTDRKTAALNRMSDLAVARSSALSQAGIVPTYAAITAWLQSDANTTAAWADLMAAAAEARELNHMNGMLIARQLNRTQSALSVLKAGAGAGSLYGPNGQSTNATSNRSFAAT